MTERQSEFKVLVTRPQHQGESLCAEIERIGARAINFPLIEIVSLTENRETVRHLSENPDCDLLIFISQNAVAHAVDMLGGDISRIADLPIYAVGQATARMLHQAGIKQVHAPATGSDSESLLKLPDLQANQINTKKITIIRGHGGREHLADTLRERGAEVNYVEVYHRKPAVYDQAMLEKIFGVDRPDLIVITSGESLQILFDMLISGGKHDMLTTPLVLLGIRLSELADSLGFSGKRLIADEASDTGLTAAVKKLMELTRNE
jgi:uroporphyrinogen-III synthase